MPVPAPPNLLRRLAFPIFGCILFAVALRFGGDTIQVIGVEALDTTQRILGYALGIGLILFLAILAQRLIQLVVLEGLVATAMGSPVPGLLTQLSGLIVYLVALAAMLSIVFHQDLTVLWAASGIAGFVFGMALKDMILDAFTGLAINLDRPFKIGDVIQLHRAGDTTIEGEVKEISWRTTRIADWFGNLVVVPNSKLASSTITNFSAPVPRCRLPIPIVLDAEVAPERAIRILEAAAVEGSSPYALADTPAPRVWAKSLTATGVEYVVNIYPPLDSQIAARNAVIARLLHHLAQAGLRPAWPKQEQATGTAPLPLKERPDPAQLVRLLEGTALFGDLEPDDLLLLAEGARLVVVAAGALVVQAGETALALLIVVEGVLTVDPPRTGGGSVLLGPGRAIGSAAALTGEGYPDTVRGRTASLVAEIDQALIRRLLSRRPEAARRFSRRLAEQMVAADPGTGDRRVQLSASDLADDLLVSIRRTFADLRLL